MANKIELTSAQFLKQLNFIYYGLILSPFLYAPIAVYIKESGFGTKADQPENYVTIVMYLDIVLIIASLLFFNHHKKKIVKETEHLTIKLIRYRKLFISTLGILVLGLVITLISYFLTNSYYLIAFAGAVALVFIYRRPRVVDISKQLNLSDHETSRLNDPTDVIIG